MENGTNLAIFLSLTFVFGVFTLSFRPIFQEIPLNWKVKAFIPILPVFGIMLAYSALIKMEDGDREARGLKPRPMWLSVVRFSPIGLPLLAGALYVTLVPLFLIVMYIWTLAQETWHGFPMFAINWQYSWDIPQIKIDWSEMGIDNGTAIALIAAGLLGLIAVMTSLSYSSILRIPLCCMNLVFKPFGVSKQPWKEACQQVNLIKAMTYLIGGAYTGIVGFGVSCLAINFGMDPQLARLGIYLVVLFYLVYLSAKILILYEENLVKKNKFDEADLAALNYITTRVRPTGTP